MDIMITEKYRKDIYDFIKQYLSEEEFNWVKGVFSDISKKAMISSDDEAQFKAYYLYKNLKSYLKYFVHDLDGGAILMTIYMCALQLGVRKFNDSVLNMKSIVDNYDLNDFNQCTTDDINHFDLSIMSKITRDPDDEHEFYCCGLLTLYALDYL